MFTNIATLERLPKEILSDNIDDPFIQLRIVRSNVYNLIERLINDFVFKKDESAITRSIELLEHFGNACQFEGCSDIAYNLYEHFISYLREEVSKYGQDARGRYNSIDRTEIYYNMGYLKYIKGDIDRAFHFFARADKEYTRCKNAPEGNFLQGLIDNKETVFHSFSFHIKANCSNFMPGVFGAFEYQGIFGRNMQESDIKNLLKEFDLHLLFQFILTMEYFWKFFSVEHNLIKSIKIIRSLGEFSWLLECYLRSFQFLAPRIMLKDRLTTLVKNAPTIKKEFNDLYNSIIKNKGKDTTAINKQLTDLLARQEKEKVLEKKSALCLLITLVIRNHTSHDLDDSFVLFQKGTEIKKTFLSILMSFFIVWYVSRQRGTCPTPIR